MKITHSLTMSPFIIAKYAIISAKYKCHCSVEPLSSVFPTCHKYVVGDTKDEFHNMRGNTKNNKKIIEMHFNITSRKNNILGLSEPEKKRRIS